MFTIDAFLEALTLEPVGTDRYRATNLRPITTWSSAASSWRSR